MPTISKHLALLFIIMAWKMCTASHPRVGSGDDDVGSGDISVDQIDTEFNVEFLAWRPTQFFIYWLEPDTNSEVSYYQVSYNVSVIYQTAAGQRIFNDSQTSDELYNDNPFGIPLYNTNSTYTVQVIAVTVEKEIISGNITISPDYLIHHKVVGQPDAISFFQLGLELTDPHATIDCQSLEGNYSSVLPLARSQLSQAVQDVCTEAHDNNETCVTQFANDYFHCHNNSRLIYVARVVSTAHTNTTTFLRYLTVLMGHAEIWLHNQSFSVISLPSCPLSIPSAEEFNCGSLSLTIGGSNETVIDNNSSITTNTTTSERANDIVTITIIALSCFVGIILMTSSVVGMMYVCNICNHYQGDVESIDLEDEEQQKMASLGRSVEEREDLPTVSYPGGPPSNVHVSKTQTFSMSLNGDTLPSLSHSNSHCGSHSSDNNLLTTSL